LRLAASGKTRAEIARERGVSVSGVRHTLSDIRFRLKVQTTEEAVERWRGMKETTIQNSRETVRP
jgi:DNA-binding CsgD family transcriptional regulator